MCASLKAGVSYNRRVNFQKRTPHVESVGDDIQVALQEQKARQSSPSSETPRSIISVRKTLREATQEFLAVKSEAWRLILGVFGDFYGWDKNPASFQRTNFATPRVAC